MLLFVAVVAVRAAAFLFAAATVAAVVARLAVAVASPLAFCCAGVGAVESPFSSRCEGAVAFCLAPRPPLLSFVAVALAAAVAESTPVVGA